MNNLAHPTIQFDYAGLFDSDRTWRHPDRVGKNYEIMYVTQGEMYIREEDRDYHLKRGQILILSPEKRHLGYRDCERVRFYWVHFNIVGDGALPFEERFFESFENSYLFKELLHYNNLPHKPDYLVNALLLHILSELCHLSQERNAHYDSNAEKIYEWIRIQADARLTVAKVAEHFGYTSDHLARICKKNYGVGACELINRFVIARAKELLCNTGRYVKEIAWDLEFPDDKSFIGFFQYHENCSPTEFRNRFSKIHMNSQ
jgi:AraC-like DNA-binding protein